MQIPVEDIKVKRRVRPAPGDLEPLMDSMRRYGLLNPVTINSNQVLIAGARRLAAAKKLGWHTINAIVLDGTDKVNELEMEIEENTQRSNLTEQELRTGYVRLERLRNPNILVRIWGTIVGFFKRLFGPKY